MELRQLRYFLTVAEEGHFTRAAERLYISQPALSQQIRQLESELGAVLIDRAGRRVRLTEAGAIVARHARRALRELDAAQTALDELAGLQRGSLSIGVVQTVNAYLLPYVVATFASTYPGIRLHIEERSAGEIERGLLDGWLQIGIGFVPAAADEIEAEPLFDEELMVIVAEAHPLAGRGQIEVRALRDESFMLLSSAFCTRRLWDACAQAAGIQPRVVAEMNTINGLLAAIRQTAAATVLPALALSGDQHGGLQGLRLINPTPRRTVGLLRRRNGYQCAATRTFTRIFRAAAAELLNARGMSLLESHAA